MNTLIKLSTIAISVVLVGCGGSSSSDKSAKNTAKISGTVPGTLIEAFCDDEYYQMVKSTKNATEKHPFSITVPKNTNCKLMMTTNENDAANRVITPIGFKNGETFVLSKDVDFGHISLKMNYRNADDKDGDHLIDTPHRLDVDIHSNNKHVHDKDNNGVIDAYDDSDDDGIVYAYEDNDNDGIVNIHDHDKDGKPHHLDHNGNHDNGGNNGDGNHDNGGNNGNGNHDNGGSNGDGNHRK